jgi:hypothetical protein
LRGFDALGRNEICRRDINVSKKYTRRVDSEHPLIEVSEHVRAEARHSRVAVIFDLDSTLFCVSPRSQHILRQLGGDPGFSQQFTSAAEILRNIEVLPNDYSVRDILARTPIEHTQELAEHIRAYWRKHFFSSIYLDKDSLYPSANEYVSHLHGLGAEIVYLTGRPLATMREGTVRMLYNHAFPLYDESKLFMKPDDLQTDEKFKVTVLKDLVHDYDHIWFFENEPVIIEDIRLHVPQVHIVFVNSAHSKKAPQPVGLRTIQPDFAPGLIKK